MLEASTQLRQIVGSITSSFNIYYNVSVPCSNYSLFPALDKADGDYQKVWDQHCADKARLEEYASAMHMLAVNHWTKQAPEGRVEWCYQTATEFFRGGGLRKLMEKQKRKQQFHEDLKECCCCFVTDDTDRCSVSM